MRFYLLDKISEWKIGRSAQGIKNITLSEDFFNDHFPRYPLMPGVLILEALAQLSGLLLETTVERDYQKKLKALLTMLDKVKFRNTAKPGDTLNLKTKIVSIREDSGKVETAASVGHKIIAETTMTFVFVVFHDPELEKKRQRLLDFWLKDLS